MKIACCARKLKGETRKIFTPPQEWACKAYALTQFSELSMVMEYDSCTTTEEERVRKKMRKAYEAHQLGEGRSAMTAYYPRTDGKCGVLTTVEKDNYLMVYEDDTDKGSDEEGLCGNPHG